MIHIELYFAFHEFLIRILKLGGGSPKWGGWLSTVVDEGVSAHFMGSGERGRSCIQTDTIFPKYLRIITKKFVSRQYVNFTGIFPEILKS